MLDKNCTKPYLVRYIEAMYIYTDKNDCYIRFMECKSLKEFSSLEQYQFAEDFQRLHTGVKLRCPACFSFQILSFEYSHYETKK